MKAATSIEKVCRVLDTFSARPVMGLREVAQRTALLPSDVHRILNSLAQFGYMEQDQSRKYRLGLRLLRLGRVARERNELCAVARPCMRRLSESAEVTTNLAVLDPHGLEVVFVEQVESSGETQVGTHAGPHCTSVGKVLVSHLDRDKARLILERRGLPKRTRKTITEVRGLERELDVVRSQRWAIDREETYEGVCCIGAPVYNHSRQVVAALSATVPSVRFTESFERRLVGMVGEAAARLSVAFGQELHDAGDVTRVEGGQARAVLPMLSDEAIAGVLQRWR